MRTATACLLVSALAHLALFPGFLDWMLRGSHTPQQGGSKEKLQIRLVKRKKPKVAPRQTKVRPKRKLTSQRPKMKRPKLGPRKPKSARPRPQAKPKLARPRPQAKPKLAKSKPRRQPKSRESVKPLAKYPKAKPSYPRSKRKAPRKRRPKLMTSSRPSDPVSARPTVEASFTEPEPIPIPPEEPTKPEPVPAAPEIPGESEEPALSEPESLPAPPPAPVEPESPGGDLGGESQSSEKSPAPRVPKATPKPPAKPKTKPAPKPKPKPEPKKKPKPKPKSKPENANRPVSVSFPEELRLPARFRRETFRTEVRVRVVVSVSGAAQLSLRSASGNPEIDDFVLEQVREKAKFQAATDAEGGPKRGRATFTVKIVVD